MTNFLRLRASGFEHSSPPGRLRPEPALQVLHEMARARRQARALVRERHDIGIRRFPSGQQTHELSFRDHSVIDGFFVVSFAPEVTPCQIPLSMSLFL